MQHPWLLLGWLCILAPAIGQATNIHNNKKTPSHKGKSSSSDHLHVSRAVESLMNAFREESNGGGANDRKLYFEGLKLHPGTSFAQKISDISSWIGHAPKQHAGRHTKQILDEIQNKNGLVFIGADDDPALPFRGQKVEATDLHLNKDATELAATVEWNGRVARVPISELGTVSDWLGNLIRFPGYFVDETKAGSSSGIFDEALQARWKVDPSNAEEMKIVAGFRRLFKHHDDLMTLIRSPQWKENYGKLLEENVYEQAYQALLDPGAHPELRQRIKEKALENVGELQAFAKYHPGLVDDAIEERLRDPNAMASFREFLLELNDTMPKTTLTWAEVEERCMKTSSSVLQALDKLWQQPGRSPSALRQVQHDFAEGLARMEETMSRLR